MVLGGKRSVPVFYGTSSDAFKCVLSAIYLFYALPSFAFFALLGRTAVGVLGPTLGALVLWRLLTRRLWLFDDRRLTARGFWYSTNAKAVDVTAVTYVPYMAHARSFEGHRLYVSVRRSDGATNCLCISSNLKAASARKTAEALLDALAPYSGHPRLQLAESTLPPEGSKGGWRVAIHHVGRRLQILGRIGQE